MTKEKKVELPIKEEAKEEIYYIPKKVVKELLLEEPLFISRVN